LSAALLFASFASFASAAGNRVILDKAAVEILGIETTEVTESDFEETAFALGRIEEIPENHGVLSSRIPGRVVGIEAREGDTVTAGQTLVRVESRQPGDPPPVIDLKAPIGGLVVESHVRIGEPVEPEKELLDISDLNNVLAIARIPEHQAGKLKPGSTIARIRIAALGDEAFEGKMLRFGTSADRTSGTIDAVFQIPNPGLRMRPGMRAEFEVVLSKRAGVLSVPKEAVQGDPATRHVFVKDFDLPNTFVKTPVKLGQTGGGRIEILSGVFPGDEVVTHGAYPLGFAGGAGPSLKEALDAAHGHEHNEDGSEKGSAPEAGHEDHDHGDEDHDHDHAAASPIRERVLIGLAGLFATLFAVTLFIKRQPAA
ncbi:MAG TPA: efflux RND transporter periplasmic adaptor subunit, partial [Luteolibacter sp.]|nr:efflux RND transporter periplasmic adaptor subunit [Luteolibacter sp.]